jgi:hypothetical protein
MPHATQPSPGLQAFILCGPGVSLNTFTSSPKDLPKALIPIANRPMVWYPLDWCYRMGVTGMLTWHISEIQVKSLTETRHYPGHTSRVRCAARSRTEDQPSTHKPQPKARSACAGRPNTDYWYRRTTTPAGGTKSNHNRLCNLAMRFGFRG